MKMLIVGLVFFVALIIFINISLKNHLAWKEYRDNEPKN
jgi:hypothetical protein